MNKVLRYLSSTDSSTVGEGSKAHQLSATEFSADESVSVVLAAKFRFNEVVEN